MQATDAAAHTTPEQLAAALNVLWHHLMKGSAKQVYALLDELDVGFTHVKALHVLTDLDREVSVKELAEELGMSLPGTSRLVDALHRKGFVDRREDPNDRRTKRLLPTAAGVDAVQRIDSARLRSLSAFTASLPPEQRDRLAAALADLPLPLPLPPPEPRTSP